MVKTSIVVQFGAEEDAFLTAELDYDLNGGRSSFLPGDPVWFRVYSDISYTVKTSAGSVSQSPSSYVTGEEEEVIQFPLEKIATVSKPIVSFSSPTWYGDVPPSFTGATNGLKKASQTEFQIDDNTRPYIGKVTYATQYHTWKLTPPTITIPDFSILVVIQGA
jgi:hypothetical protein